SRAGSGAEATGSGAGPEGGTYFLAWTTTPWTLPSNLGLALGPEIEYLKVEDSAQPGTFYILAKERIGAYYKEESEYRIVRSYKGSELAGWTYEPLFPYFAQLAAEGAFKTH